MMARIRYRLMFILSMLIGYVVASVLLPFGRLAPGARGLIREQATEHAEAAARKEGPYLAPLWLVGVSLLFFGLLCHLVAMAVR